MAKKYYITTPLYYVNAKPHIGHSYTQIACDSVARFMRQAGREVFFMTGTDEHGEKIEQAAIAAGLGAGEEQKFVDSIVPDFKALWMKLNIKYDHFIRTTDAYHVKAVQAFLEKLYREEKIYKKNYSGWFCTPCETFWTQTQAADGICPECKRPLEKLDEANYFLKTSEYQKWLIDYINSNPDFIKPDFRRNEVLGFLNSETLTDLCITRPKSRMRWGIEVPFDKEYVTYVWFDALINYASGIGYPDDMKRFASLWPADMQVMGKDIIRHHAIYWVIMLHALGIEPPKAIFAHGWWVFKGEKMSKSKGNVVDPAEMVSKYGVDPYRYFLLKEVQFGMDGAFSEEAFIARFNSDLANDIGNLLSRTLTMAEKYFAGRAPAIARNDFGNKKAEEIAAEAAKAAIVMEEAMPDLNFTLALSGIWNVISLANKFIEDSKPWVLAKENKQDELALVIYTLLEALRTIAIGIYSFMPETAQKIWAQLGMEGSVESVPFSDAKTWGKLTPGTKVSKSGPLFPRIEIKK
ncbi:MAG: methionine--tRNA ligase [Candidatus Omnitrophica bacterium]|nr:methionine--tRNA ligase [Candidatus Omnitrophota bacterium]